MTHDEQMLRKAQEKLERIRREYRGDTRKHLESAAMKIVMAYERRVQEGRRPSVSTESTQRQRGPERGIVMKLHKDGTVEGTPQELYLYSKLTEVKKEPFKVVPPLTTTGVDQGTYPTGGSADARYTGSGVIYVGTLQPKVSMHEYPTAAEYVRGLMSAIGKGVANKEYGNKPFKFMSIDEVQREIDERYSGYMNHLLNKGLFH